jgi:hypothetical protein
MGGKAAGSDASQTRHRHWDKVVSAAYLRMIGHTQAEVATSAGRSERTIQAWEADRELWTAARDEARGRWLQEVTDAARRSVLKGAGRIPDLGLKILERIDPELAPPKQQHEHAGEGGGPIEVTVIRRIIRPNDDD